MYEANKELQAEAIGVYVSDIHFQTDDEAELELENIEKVIVTLSSDKQDETDIAIVQPIEIGKDQSQQETTESPIGNEVKEILTDLWGIEEEKIEYIWEEGAT